MVMIWNYYHLKIWNTKFTKNQNTFKILYLLKNDEEKNMSCIWTTINSYYNVAKTIVLKFIHMKKFWEKGHTILFYSNPTSSLYLVCTQTSIHWKN
jgi:hypothetical protein